MLFAMPKISYLRKELIGKKIPNSKVNLKSQNQALDCNNCRQNEWKTTKHSKLGSVRAFSKENGGVNFSPPLTSNPV